MTFDENEQTERVHFARISTGNAQLDTLLDGGFPANSINIVMGEPGSGKTVFAQRLVFANAIDDKRPILYLTTLSEPLEKLVRYLQQFEFFDANKIATGAVQYESLGEELQTNGIDALVPKLKELIKTVSPKLLVIDSFKAIQDLSTSLRSTRLMLHEMAGLLTAYDTTAFLVGEYREDDIPTCPEFAVADGIVEFARKKQGTRDERYMRVLKLRGSHYQEGLHAFRIGIKGLEVFPRLTSPHIPLEYTRNDARLSTGIAGLDKMLQGGVWRGGATLVEGPTGGGKTTLSLQFILEGLKRGEAGLYVNFQENPTQLARTIQSLGWDIEEAKQRGLHFLYASPVELQIDSILTQLFRIIQEKDIKRVVVDSVGDLIAAASDLNRLYGYLYALLQHFTVKRVASMITLETAPTGMHPLEGRVSALTDAIVRLQLELQDHKARRTLQVVKARGTDHDLCVRELRISAAGVDVT